MTNCLAEKELNTVVLRHKCTNCMACYNVCPVSAIEIKEDKDGFAYPVINEEKCTHCGLCTKKCPALNLGQTKEISERLDAPIAYGGYIKDETLRKNSSSGGAFSALAKYILDKGGYVCGARIVQGGFCEHVIVDNWEDLAPLRGSKYVQSNINNCYKEIKTLLEQDKYVLFTGTPCQVAGLYAVLGKDYEKLITVDLLCHGTPSQKVFREYLNEITDGHADDVLNVNFREKTTGWRNPSLTIDGKDLSIIVPNVFYNGDLNNSYIIGFLKNMLIRKSCCDCQFNGLPREADITIGDFWGIENCDKTLDDNNGTSALLINSEKAKRIISNVCDAFSKFKSVDDKFITKVNMVNKKAYNHPYRDYFLERYRNRDYVSICELIKECLNKNDGVGVLNYSFSLDNYGSVLTAYALQKKIKDLGYTPVNIWLEFTKPTSDIGDLYNFSLAHISHTKLYRSTEELKETNKFFKTFIVGPDCMWHQMYTIKDFYNTYFNFVKLSKVIASYATSFCYKKPNLIINNSSDYKKRKILTRRFDFVGVREESGVDVCRSLFDVDATHVLDAVFLVDISEWIKLANESKKTYDTNYPVKFIFNEDQYPKNLMTKINTMKNLVSLYNGEPYWKRFRKTEEFKVNTDVSISIYDWLSGICHSDLVITDSYHGLCFAIIFKKQFILLNKKEQAQERLISLCNQLGIEDRFAENEEDIDRLIKEQIDYEQVDKKLNVEKLKSEQFLKDMLVYEKENKYLVKIIESIEEELNSPVVVNTPSFFPTKQKWYFLGIQVFKIAMRKGEKWFYLFGVPLVKEVKKENKTYYKLFGFIRVLKKAVRG